MAPVTRVLRRSVERVPPRALAAEREGGRRRDRAAERRRGPARPAGAPGRGHAHLLDPDEPPGGARLDRDSDAPGPLPALVLGGRPSAARDADVVARPAL